MPNPNLETWDLYYPKAAATGLPFARCRIDSTDVLWVHAAPPVLTVTVRTGSGQVRAETEDLQATGDTPMTRLACRGGQIERQDLWPGPEHLGELVVLPGGEAGVLKSWWNAPDHSEWRWEMEFYNHR